MEKSIAVQIGVQQTKIAQRQKNQWQRKKDPLVLKQTSWMAETTCKGHVSYSGPVLLRSEDNS